MIGALPVPRGLGRSVLAIAGASLSLPAAGHSQLDPAKLSGFMEHAMEAWGVPGAAVVVVKNDSVVFLGGFGTREVGKDQPVDGETVFALASNTKPFTTAALAMLVDRDILDWDDPVSRWLPSLRFYDRWISEHATVRDLVTHRLGYPGWAADHLWQGGHLTRQEIIERFRYQRPAGQFRSTFAYSNVSFIFAGEVLARAAGTSYQDFVTTNLLEPLGMKRSGFGIAELDQWENVARPHMVVGYQLTPVEWFNTATAAAAAGLNSSACDIGQWLRFQLAGGRWYDRVLIEPGTMNEIRTPQIYVPWSQVWPAGDRHSTAYGLGWYLFDYGGRRILQHGGEIDGMSSRITLVPEEGLGVAVLTNVAPGSLATTSVTNHILDLMMGIEREEPWLEQLLQAQEKEERWELSKRSELLASRKKGTKRSLPWSSYLGEYYDSLSGYAWVGEKDGKVWFSYNDKYRAELEHWHYDTFAADWQDPYVSLWAGEFITFVPDGAGSIASLKVKFDNEIVFSKVD